MNNKCSNFKKVIENKWFSFPFIVFFMLAPFICEMLDIFLELIKPKFNPKVTPAIWNFDVSLLNQLLYFSDWLSILTIIWGLIKFINFFKKPDKRNKWAESDETINLIVTIAFCTLISYTGGFIGSRDTVAGFDTWYNILKSIIEHWVSPTLLIIYYFLRKRISDKTNKEFLKDKAWKNLIIPLLYFTFTLARFYVFKFSGVEYNKLGSQTYPQSLPTIVYSELDPKALNSNFLPFFIVLSALLGGFGLSLLFNVLSIKVNKVIHLTQNENIKDKQIKNNIENTSEGNL